jgi:hypothetical protein
VLELAVADPLHPGLNLHRAQPRDAALDRFLQALPPNAPVATQEEAYTHLALRDPYATLLPERSDMPIGTCLVLLDSEFPDSPRFQEYGATFVGLVRERHYIPVAKSNGIALYRRADCR